MIELIGFAIIAVGLYFVGRLVYMVVGMFWVTHMATQREEELLAKDLASATTDSLRRRLLEDPYLRNDLGKDPAVQEFLTRLADGEEVALAREYPRANLRKLLGRAEVAVGGATEERAVDTITEISALLQELAGRHDAGGAGGPTKG